MSGAAYGQFKEDPDSVKTMFNKTLVILPEPMRSYLEISIHKKEPITSKDSIAQVSPIKTIPNESESSSSKTQSQQPTETNGTSHL